MNNKLNVPDEIWLGKKDYSFWTDWRVNGWLFAAAAISGLADILFRSTVQQWPVGMRIVVAAAPFLAIAFWVRTFSRWVGGMDELHRRITLAAVLFSTGATFFVVMLWHRLNQAGLFATLFSKENTSRAVWDMGTVSHIFLLLTVCYFTGFAVFNRRYR